MANTRTSNVDYEKVVIDTAPAAEGFFTNSVTQRRSGNDIPKIVVIVRGTGTWTAKLQFMAKGDTDWTDSTEELAIGDIKEIESNISHLQWRVGIKQGAFTSGSAVLSINW